MKYIIYILFSLTLVAVEAAANHMDTLKKAVAIVESGEDKFANNGVAISQYQITRVVWETHSRMPWRYAKRHTDWKDVHDEAERVAEQHLRWIAERLEHNGKDVNPYNMALVWRVGMRAFLNRDVRKSHIDYAERASNLFFRYSPGLITGPDGYAFYYKER